MTSIQMPISIHSTNHPIILYIIQSTYLELASDYLFARNLLKTLFACSIEQKLWFNRVQRINIWFSWIESFKPPTLVKLLRNCFGGKLKRCEIHFVYISIFRKRIVHIFITKRLFLKIKWGKKMNHIRIVKV